MSMKHLIVRGISTAHAAVVASVVGSMPVAIIWPKTQSYVAAGMAGLLATWALWRGDCPLTVWEEKLRAKFQMPSLSDGFIRHHFARLTGVRVSKRLHRQVQFAYLGVLVLVILVV
jgi:hypothetical protein